MAYGAFSPDILRRLKDHHDIVSKCKPMTRGGQFDCYGDGSMIAHGSSLPSGGAPGSAYAPVANFDANTLEAMDIIFNEIEASPVPKCMLLSELMSHVI